MYWTNRKDCEIYQALVAVVFIFLLVVEIHKGDPEEDAEQNDGIQSCEREKMGSYTPGALSATRIHIKYSTLDIMYLDVKGLMMWHSFCVQMHVCIYVCPIMIFFIYYE